MAGNVAEWTQSVSRDPGSIGPYQIERRLGAGGMAETFVAVRHGPAGFEQRVCLKRIRRDKRDQQALIESFEREARIGASLRHANIVQVLDFGLDQGEPYLAFELIDGVDFEALAQKAGEVDTALVTCVAFEVATALDVAHRSGVVHRDVSPSNILVSIEGEVKLADFGIAKATRRGEPTTQTGMVKGKVAYLAPEYVRTGRIGPQADLYSLGVALYEALSGHRPYDGSTALAIFECAARGDHVPLRIRNQNLSTRLTQIVEALIEPDPESRPQGAAEVLAELDVLPRMGRREIAARVREIQGANGQPRARGPLARYMKTDKLPMHAVSAEPELLSKQTPGKDASIARRLGLAARLMMSLTLMLAAIAIKLARPAAEPRLASSTRLASTRALAGASGLTRRKPTEAVRWDPATLIWKTNASETIAPNANDPSTLQPSNPPTKSTAASHATLRVTVIPYGEVWIDGVHVGSSPIALGVTEGNHHVRAISPQFRFNRSVALASGTSKTFVFH